MSSISKGIGFGLAAGAFWGLSFLIPKLFTQLPPGFLALARCTGFALLAVIMLARSGKLSFLRGPHWKAAAWLSVMGYSGYYYLLIYSIRFAGIPVSSLLIGLLPLTISIGSRDTVYRPLQFTLSLSLISVGIALLNAAGFNAVIQGTAMNADFVVGVGLSVVSLAAWTVFAIQNSRFLKSSSSIDNQTWAATLGVYSLVTMVPMVALDVCLQGGMPAFSPTLAAQFVSAVVILGFGCSFIATVFWNIASKNVPTGILGQLIVSETVFALLYEYIDDRKLPSSTEGVSIALLIAGVILGIRAFSKPRQGAHLAN